MAKGLTNAYHDVEVESEEICRRILTGLPPDYDFVRKVLSQQPGERPC